MGRVGQIQIVKCDIRKDDEVTAALHQADAAINLVAILHQSGTQRFETLQAEGAGRIAKTAATHGVKRLLHVSTLGASADLPSVYAKTKAEGERLVREAFPTATIFRPSIVFGPEDNFFNKFGWMARLSPFLPLIGGGVTRFQPVFAGDVARAAAQVLRDSATAGKTYELGGPEVMSFKQILQLVLKETRRKRALVNIPFPIARFQAALLGILPKPMLTLDQVRLLGSDNVVADGALGLRDLGIAPTAAEAIVPSYLWRFRKHGQFEQVAT